MSIPITRSSPSPRERGAFVLRKLHSLTGVVPIGFFLVVYLWIGAKAIQGRVAFETALEDALDTPYLVIFEVLLLWLPLTYHALYGLKITFAGRHNVGSYGYSRNWAYSLQRLTGIVALAFIAYHSYRYRLGLVLGSMTHDDVFPRLCSELSHTSAGGVPLVALAYLVGVVALVFHLANGLFGFCFSWGITGSARSSRIIGGFCGVLGIVLFAMGANTVIYFATGSRLVLSPPASIGAQPPITCQDLDAEASWVREAGERLAATSR